MRAETSSTSFTRLLMQWNQQDNNRMMPWKGEKDPYKIWLSEIILQQTRVEQGLGYYQRFIKQYPTISELASANDDGVLKLWEGLGYYSRCRNLLFTARLISRQYNGKFPDTYQEILALKGVGPYTAAAIASFAFGLPHAVVDGNVFRVLSRYFGIATATDSGEGKRKFTAIANDVLDKKHPALYNQAIMDFGATICKPVAPLCEQCILQTHCYAYLNKLINELPVKSKKLKIRKRWFYYLIMDSDGEIAIQQRLSKDIWEQLFEFPMVELSQEATIPDILHKAESEGIIKKDSYKLITVSPLYKQQLSHQLIAGQFIRINSSHRNKTSRWILRSDLKKYAFPRFINSYLENENLQSLF